MNLTRIASSRLGSGGLQFWGCGLLPEQSEKQPKGFNYREIIGPHSEGFTVSTSTMIHEQDHLLAVRNYKAGGSFLQHEGEQAVAQIDLVKYKGAFR